MELEKPRCCACGQLASGHWCEAEGHEEPLLAGVPAPAGFEQPGGSELSFFTSRILGQDPVFLRCAAAETPDGEPTVVLRAVRPSFWKEASDARRKLLIRRMKREVECLASLDGPFYPNCHGGGLIPLQDLPPLPFLATELLEGPTLLAVLTGAFERGLPLDRFFLLAGQLAAALLPVSSGPAYRRVDLSPVNVRIRAAADGLEHIALADWSLLQPGETVLGQGGGTLDSRYLAPETVKTAGRGRDGQGEDGRATAYSLGVLFWEMISGFHPAGFEYPPGVGVPDPAAVFHPAGGWGGAHLERDGLPGGLGSMLTRMISLEPGARPSLAEVLISLQREEAAWREDGAETDQEPRAGEQLTVDSQTREETERLKAAADEMGRELERLRQDLEFEKKRFEEAVRIQEDLKERLENEEWRFQEAYTIAEETVDDRDRLRKVLIAVSVLSLAVIATLSVLLYTGSRGSRLPGPRSVAAPTDGGVPIARRDGGDKAPPARTATPGPADGGAVKAAGLGRVVPKLPPGAGKVDAGPAPVPSGPVAPTGKGSVVVRTETPGARAFIDGRAVGRTPVSGREVFPGRHRVEIRRCGRLTVERELVVRAGGETEVSVKMASKPGAARQARRGRDRAPMVLVGAGCFTMGSAKGDRDEKPAGCVCSTR